MSKRPMPLSEALFLLIAGFLMSIVFTLSPFYWNVRVEPSQCPVVETEFLSWKAFYDGARLRDLAIDCADGERYFTDAHATRDSLAEELSQLEPGTPLTLRIHPNSHDLLEIRAGDRELLNFDFAMSRIERAGKGFFRLAVVMYLFTLIGLVNTVRHFRMRRRKRHA